MTHDRMSEWILRVMPLPVRDPFSAPDSSSVELARFRMRIVAPHERPASRGHGARWGVLDIGPVRIIGLDSANPHGGVGGSLDGDQCAWLVRELDGSRDRYVIVASHDGPRTLTSGSVPEGAPPRVLGPEALSLLLAHRNVIAWVSGTMHERAGRRHGDHGHGFWEIPGAASGLGAPLAGGLSVVGEDRHLHQVIVLRGALAGASGAQWEGRDPLPEVSAAARRAPEAARR